MPLLNHGDTFMWVMIPECLGVVREAPRDFPCQVPRQSPARSSSPCWPSLVTENSSPPVAMTGSNFLFTPRSVYRRDPRLSSQQEPPQPVSHRGTLTSKLSFAVNGSSSPMESMVSSSLRVWESGGVWSRTEPEAEWETGPTLHPTC